MIFEDVHWSDPTTRELLDLLIERVPAVRLMAIVTYRPEFSPPWVGRPQVTLMTLNRPNVTNYCFPTTWPTDREQRARYIGEWLKSEARYLAS